MIIERFDNGWGPEFPVKQIETAWMYEYLRSFNDDAVITVVINSIWYTNDYHAQVMERLRKIRPRRIVLVALLDCAIPQPEWYQEFDCEVIGVGCYAGASQIDAWAMICGDYMRTPDGLLDGQHIDTAYMCLNRKPHWHRMQLYRQLEQYNLLDRGLVSMGGDNAPALRLLPNDRGQCDLAPNAGTQQNGINNDIMSLGNPDNWRRCFLNVVTETVFDIERDIFGTEKIFKPMLGQRPFLVYAPNGAVNWLAQRGFQDYCSDFGDITDADPRQPHQMPQVIQALCDQTPEYWRHKFVALQEKIMYNYNRFQAHAREQKTKISKGIVCQP